MSRQIINETCALQIPDHFEILSGKDLDGMRQGTGDPFRWGVRDRENHMIIIALWKQAFVLYAGPENGRQKERTDEPQSA